jgi:hypothetical protein
MATMSAAAFVLCTAVTTTHTKPSITFSRTQDINLSLGSQQPEPQKPRKRHLPTNVSALLFAGRWRRPDSPNASFRATSQLQIHRRPTPCRRLC